MKILWLLSAVVTTISLAPEAYADQRSVKVDVAVYSATPAGIQAAIAVQREGRTVAIVEPSRWVGGVLGAGLKPMQDCPNYSAVGGATRPLLKSLGASGGHLTSDLRSLNPTAIREDFLALLKQHKIEVIFEHRVTKVEKRGNAITAAAFDQAPYDALGCPPAEPKIRDSLRVTAKVFIDASYEGDLLAQAGVSYRVGREAEAEFDEPHAGVQPPMELAPLDPFVHSGKRDSGLLKWVENDHGKPVGSADGYTQAYNYRYYTTADPQHRVPITPPANYDRHDFELVGRYVEHLVKSVVDRDALHRRLVGICPGWLNSGEWNYERSSLFSMAPLGISQQYADCDYATRARVWKQHQDYLRGLYEFMRTDERVPKWYRDELSNLGLDRRAHPETKGWPHQLYIRVARRLKGQYTVTAHDVYNKSQIDDPICLAQYGIDTYPSRRIWLERDGQVYVGIEGKMFIGGNKGPTNVPYPIAYRAITPREDECANLLVPVCISATHLGYASARMEPVFMICGESAGIAACHAIAQRTSVQEIDMAGYLRALEAAGQKLRWDTQTDRASDGGRAENALTYQRLLNECDADKNGTVSKGEWIATKAAYDWLFKFIDKNDDQQIDQAEYEAFQAYKRKNPDWEKLQPMLKK